MRTSWKLVGNPICQPWLATSFQLVRPVGCGLKSKKDTLNLLAGNDVYCSKSSVRDVDVP